LICFVGCSNQNDSKGFLGTEQSQQSAVFCPSLDTEAEIALYAIGPWENFEALEEVAQDFNEYYPNITIHYILPDNYALDLSNRLITGEELDFYLIQNSEGDDLTSFTKDAVNLEAAGVDFSNMAEGVRQKNDVGGERKLLPIMQSVNGYMVNLSLLEKYSLSVPTNQKEFTEVCDKLKENGIVPIMGHPDTVYQPSVNSLVMEIVLAENREEIIEALKAGDDSWGIVRRNLQEAMALKEKGYLSEEGSSLKDNYDAVIMRFLEGDVPFMACSAENFSGVKKREARSEAFSNTPFVYQFISSPTGENGFETCYTEEIAFCAYAKSANVDYVIEFFRFLATKSELNVMATVKGMPTVTEDSGDARFTVLENLSASEKIYFADTGLDYHVLVAYREACKALGNGRVDLDGAMEIFVWNMKN